MNPAPRFRGDFQLIGDITVSPDVDSIDVGSFVLGEGEDTLLLGVQQLGPLTPKVHAYGIAGFRNENGYVLGTAKVYPKEDLALYRLSVGLPPSVQEGVITFEPRSFNLNWVKNGYPWSVRFYARGDTTSRAGATVVSNSFVSRADGDGLRLVQIDFEGRA